MRVAVFRDAETMYLDAHEIFHDGAKRSLRKVRIPASDAQKRVT
jgi:hypothetical protein